MYNERDMQSEANAKMAAQQQTKCGSDRGGELRGAAGLCAEPMRPNLIESTRMQLRDAERNFSRANRLNELHELLMKNPEVARILDLIDEVRR